MTEIIWKRMSQRWTHERPGRDCAGARCSTRAGGAYRGSTCPSKATAIRLGGRDRDVPRVALAIHEHHHRLTLGLLVHAGPELFDGADRLAIDLDDHVPGADPSLVGAPALGNVADEHTLLGLETELTRDWRREGLNREAQLALALCLGDLRRPLLLEPCDPGGEPYVRAAAHHRHGHLASDTHVGDEARQILGLRDLLPVELHDHVSGLHARLLRRGSLDLR